MIDAAELKRMTDLSNAVWNYLGVQNAADFMAWYGDVRKQVVTLPEDAIPNFGLELPR